MNIRAQFLPPVKTCPEELRTGYLDSLSHCQDALLEMLVSQSEFVVIRARKQDIGYFALTSSGSIVEFYLKPEFTRYSFLLFRRFVHERKTPSALVKTFDSLSLACSLDINTGVKVLGMLVREYQELPLPELNLECEMRLAVMTDFDAIVAVKQEVFSRPERLRHLISQQQLPLFFRAEQLIGFGIVRPIVSGRRDVEIGIAVDEPYRNKGYAAYILRDLVRYALAHGQNPVSGCAIENQASIQLGLRVGFQTRDRLLEVQF